MKSDFHTDHDAANTTTGAEAMTSATGVELDMPIKPARDPRLRRDVASRARRRGGHASPHTSISRLALELRWMSVDCIQMSALVGVALRSLVPPINGDHYA